MNSPTVTVRIPDKTSPTSQVVFNCRRLFEIENAFGETIYALAQDFLKYVPKVPTKEGESPDPAVVAEASAAAARRFNLGRASRFIAACVGMSHDDVMSKIDLGELRNAFLQLLTGLLEALSQINGTADKRDEDPESRPTEAPQTSAS